jgi:hypothetical protein
VGIIPDAWSCWKNLSFDTVTHLASNSTMESEPLPDFRGRVELSSDR